MLVFREIPLFKPIWVWLALGNGQIFGWEIMMRVKLREYLYAAVRELEIDTTPSQGRNANGRPRDMHLWFIDKWGEIARAVYGGKALKPETIDELLRGSHDIQHTHLEITHDILRLRDYGLTVEETWKFPEARGQVEADEDERELRRSVNEFGLRLREARSKHRDPLHLLRQKASSDFVFHLEAALQRDNQLLCFTAENDDPQPDRKVLTVPKGSALSVLLRPRTNGRLLLLSYNADGEKVLVLNETFNLSRMDTFEAGEFRTFKASEPAAGTSGERDIIAVNWPVSRDHKVAGLQSLLDGNDQRASVDDLRRLGGEILATENAPEQERVSAAILRINLK